MNTSGVHIDTLPPDHLQSPTHLVLRLEFHACRPSPAPFDHPLFLLLGLFPPKASSCIYHVRYLFSFNFMAFSLDFIHFLYVCFFSHKVSSCISHVGYLFSSNFIVFSLDFVYFHYVCFPLRHPPAFPTSSICFSSILSYFLSILSNFIMSVSP